jgi:cell division septation protein DedD
LKEDKPGEIMSAEKGSSKADTLVKVVLVFFISLLSFSVGTFVGKQVSDSDHRRLALEGEYKAERNVASHDEKADPSEEAITDKEVENLTEEFVNKEKSREPAAADEDQAKDEHAAVAPEHAEANGYKSYSRDKNPKEAKAEHAPETPEHAVAPEHEHAAAHPTKKGDAPHAAAQKIAANKAPSDGKAEERKPNATLPAVASSAVGKYTVQVASYQTEEEAKNHAATLKGKGWNAFYLPATIQGKPWFRVSVGLFNNDKSAREFRAQFMKESGSKSTLVQKIVQ